jgi:hypothetical protein
MTATMISESAHRHERMLVLAGPDAAAASARQRGGSHPWHSSLPLCGLEHLFGGESAGGEGRDGTRPLVGRVQQASPSPEVAQSRSGPEIEA